MAASVLTEVAAPVEASTSAVRWGPIVAGALAASTLTFVLMLIGSGIGLSMVSPWAGESTSLTTVAVSSAVGLVVVAWLSSALGGYITGRLRTKWVGIHTDETFFRDTAHGFLAWALSTLIVVAVLGSAMSAAVNTGVQATATVASGVATAASAGASATADSPEGSAMTSYFVDQLFRPGANTEITAPGPEGNAAAAAEASRILVASAASGEVSPDDKAYLGRLVAARTGLSEADATARVDAVLGRIEQARTAAQEAADNARKAGATFSLVAALALVIGAFIASAAAALGGRQRDDEETRYVTVR